MTGIRLAGAPFSPFAFKLAFSKFSFIKFEAFKMNAVLKTRPTSEMQMALTRQDIFMVNKLNNFVLGFQVSSDAVLVKRRFIAEIDASASFRNHHTAGGIFLVWVRLRHSIFPASRILTNVKPDPIPQRFLSCVFKGIFTKSTKHRGI